MQTSKEDGQISLFGQDMECGKMSQEHFPAQTEKTSKSSSNRSSKLKNHTFMLLDLRPGAGNILGPCWEYDPVWLGSLGTLNTSECPSAVVESSLSQILQDTVPSKYYLSPTACMGILRRAEERGKDLPTALAAALRLQAGIQRPEDNNLHGEIDEGDGYDGDLRGDASAALGTNCGMSTERNGALDPTPFANNQQDEAKLICGKDDTLSLLPPESLHVSGLITKGNGDCFITEEKHTTLSTGGGQAGQGYPCIFAAGFSAGAGATAGSIGYDEEIAPILRKQRLSLRTANITTVSLWGRTIRAFRATLTNAVPTVLESPSGRMWRAAIPDIVFITSALTENSMCSRRPSICSPSSPCIQKIGNLITTWPVAEHLQSL